MLQSVDSFLLRKFSSYVDTIMAEFVDNDIVASLLTNSFSTFPYSER